MNQHNQSNYPHQPQPDAHWEHPQTIPNSFPPTQHTPPTSSNVQPPLQPTQEIRPPAPNASSFIPDIKTKEILDRTYPEMSNALINIAIKKFSENSDYVNYFVREEFKQQVTINQEHSTPKEEKTIESKSSQADFSTW